MTDIEIVNAATDLIEATVYVSTKLTKAKEAYCRDGKPEEMMKTCMTANARLQGAFVLFINAYNRANYVMAQEKDEEDTLG